MAVQRARAYVHQLVRDGRLDRAEGASQLAAIDNAFRSGRPLLVVTDFDPSARQQHNHAA